MNDNPRLSFVVGAIKRQKDTFKKRQNYNRQATFLFTIGTASVSAVATVMIGASEIMDEPSLSIAAMIATAIATVISAWSGLFANRKMWIVAGKALGQLQALDGDIKYHQSQETQPTEGDVQGFYDRYKKIIEKAENAWEATHSG